MTETLSLQQLCDLGELSVRAYNICRLLRLETIKDLQQQIHNGFEFSKVRNCGQRTILELEQLCSIYGINIDNPPATEAALELEWHPVKEQKFQKAVEEGFSKLSVRGQNALVTMFASRLLTVQTFKTTVLDNPHFTLKQRNVGTKTFDELHRLFEHLKSVYKKCLTDGVPEYEQAQYVLEKTAGFKADSHYIERMANKSFPLIEFSATYLDSLIDPGEVEQYIFKNFTGQLDRVYDYEEIGKKFKYSKERIRQLAVNLKKEVPLRFEKKLAGLLQYTYYNDLIENENFIDINVFFKAQPLQAEIDKAGTLFSGFLLASLFPDKFYLVSSLDKLAKPKELYRYEVYRERKRIRGVYLINKDIIPKEFLLNILSEAFSEICKRQENDKLIPTYKLLTNIATISVIPAVEIIYSLLNKEFGIRSDATGVHIEKNTSKMVYEYVVEALEALKRPSHVSVILSKVKELFPEQTMTEDSIKSVIPRYKKVFIFFGRSSTYGLRSWEKKFHNIKGGTIRDIAEEFLKGFDEPCHISAISQYVNRYRTTNEYSIITNLKYTGETRFCFFKNGYVGLVKKNYNKKTHATNYHQEVSLEDLLNDIFTL